MAAIAYWNGGGKDFGNSLNPLRLPLLVPCAATFKDFGTHAHYKMVKNEC